MKSYKSRDFTIVRRYWDIYVADVFSTTPLNVSFRRALVNRTAQAVYQIIIDYTKLFMFCLSHSLSHTRAHIQGGIGRY
jgi:hypothetical protein